MQNTFVKTFRNEKDYSRGVVDMSRKGYSIQSVNGSGEGYKTWKGVVLAGI